jgi:ABC-type multidrug transport system permease subunit
MNTAKCFFPSEIISKILSQELLMMPLDIYWLLLLLHLVLKCTELFHKIKYLVKGIFSSYLNGWKTYIFYTAFFFILYFLFFIIVLGEAVLWHLQKFVQYIILEFTSPIALLYPSLPLFLE